MIGIQFHPVNELVFPPSAAQPHDKHVIHTPHHKYIDARSPLHALVDAAVGVELDAWTVALAVDPIAAVPKHTHTNIKN